MTSEQVDKIDIDTIVDHYLIGALWSSSDDNDIPFDEQHDISDFHADVIVKAKKDIRAFLLLAPIETIKRITLEQIGHDIWLTRNGHGAGFWDRNLGELGDTLTEICERLGFKDVYEENNNLYID